MWGRCRLKLVEVAPVQMQEDVVAIWVVKVNLLLSKGERVTSKTVDLLIRGVNVGKTCWLADRTVCSRNHKSLLEYSELFQDIMCWGEYGFHG
jgi:hypothetical protein